MLLLTIIFGVAGGELVYGLLAGTVNYMLTQHARKRAKQTLELYNKLLNSQLTDIECTSADQKGLTH